MLVILMRHGIAEDGDDDAARRLTAEGRERVLQMAQLLGRLGLVPGAILTSPRVRARETAEIVAAHFARTGATRESAALDMNGTWDEFAAMLERERQTLGDEGGILLATGHQPHLGVMTSQAVEGTRLGFDLRKGACVGLRFEGDIEPRGARMEFYLTAHFARTALVAAHAS